MAEGNDYTSIGPLNDAARKEALPLVGMLLLGMIIAGVAMFIVGEIINAL
ncbi:MAG: hypothetical protein AB1631_28365 [Acidobacteriota bacterium]